METFRELFGQYYYSYPTEHWMSKRRHRFKAKPVNEMTELEMMAGMNRDEAEQMLEDYLQNELIPQGWQWPGWFYQDEEFKELVLIKDWFN